MWGASSFILHPPDLGATLLRQILDFARNAIVIRLAGVKNEQQKSNSTRD
jgi:hypothetical protein